MCHHLNPLHGLDLRVKGDQRKRIMNVDIVLLQKPLLCYSDSIRKCVRPCGYERKNNENYIGVEVL